MPWIGNVKAVLEMWYPGQEGGTATAKLLLGQADPGGKLPITFPATADQTLFAGHPERIAGVNGILTWTEGLFTGYRWYDQQGIAPLFPFGFGLSYTNFDLSELSVGATADHGIDVKLRVRNVGSRTGAEVVQVYIGPSPDVPLGTQQVARQLVQFERVVLDPGHAQDITLHVETRSLAYWSTTRQAWQLGTGARQVFVGTSSRDLPLQGSVVLS
jgi:beta-glucosidase